LEVKDKKDADAGTFGVAAIEYDKERYYTCHSSSITLPVNGPN
jgi:hypothetical protein